MLHLLIIFVAFLEGGYLVVDFYDVRQGEAISF